MTKNPADTSLRPKIEEFQAITRQMKIALDKLDKSAKSIDQTPADDALTRKFNSIAQEIEVLKKQINTSQEMMAAMQQAWRRSL
jgi:flagellar hook-associated protein FlgK